MPPCQPQPRPYFQTAVPYPLREGQCCMISGSAFHPDHSLGSEGWEGKGARDQRLCAQCSADICALSDLTVASTIPSLSLCIPGSPGTSTLNQAEGRGDDLCHQGDREFATILIGAIPPPSLHLVVERWVPGSAGTSFPPAKGHSGSKMHLEYTVLATASLTQLVCWCPSFVLVSWHESS